ncbi:Amino acid permease 8 [Glycine max]|uniref:Amino acid transporter transmembrane domain-containing protein n=1 Tax=Glycine max TaxID=3847 RepID=A0A0R0GLW5_SOYBN|nr:amino acid permease 8-like isoform X1 [Glycine soja]KAH1213258.1 Amino acid permease 8 [Glycine max]|eukprot:XP_025981118.1 amino acid permease 8 isoform X1 [Glycine max]
MAVQEVSVIEGVGSLLDDDGKPKRRGTAWTASAHIITAVIGAGVLSLAWAMAQLGWIIGIALMLLFAIVNLYTSNLLADCYRSPDPITGKRNYAYMEAVRSNLGGKMHMVCAFVQYSNLVGLAIGYTITTAISVVTIRKINYFHHNGTAASCRFLINPYIIGFGTIEIILSQVPNFDKLSWLSIIAALMSFGYASIGAGLSIATVIQGKGKATYLMWGSKIQSPANNLWNMLIALGNIALASGYSLIAIDIQHEKQDSLRSLPPENEVMKMANKISISTMVVFFLVCACSGYATFGSETPGNILLSSGFKEPFWLIDLANVFIVVHLLGAYQVVVQPIFSAVETCASQRWPSSSFVNGKYPFRIGKMKFSLSFFRLVWRSIFVVLVTILAMAMPFFNEMLALLGAMGFYPLTIYFPVEMYIARKKIKRGAKRWLGLKTLSLVFMLLSMAIACAAIHGMNQALRKYKFFMYKE